jgi:hypothetical protein
MSVLVKTGWTREKNVGPNENRLGRKRNMPVLMETGWNIVGSDINMFVVPDA